MHASPTYLCGVSQPLWEDCSTLLFSQALPVMLLRLPLRGVPCVKVQGASYFLPAGSLPGYTTYLPDKQGVLLCCGSPGTRLHQSLDRHLSTLSTDPLSSTREARAQPWLTRMQVAWEMPMANRWGIRSYIGKHVSPPPV